MNIRRIGLCLLALSLAGLAVASGACGDDKDTEVILATTTSTVDSGLLDELIPRFEADSDYEIKPLSLGSGQALETASRGDADVVLVHSPAAEQEFVDSGNGIERTLVMHNDFIIVGPEDDPAGVAGAASIGEAMTAIADAGANFVSRGDDSGTHTLELRLWEGAGIDPTGEPWYSESGQGMGATLTIADQTGSYTVSDRGTFLSFGGDVALTIAFEGAPELLNIYHVILVNPDEHDVNEDGARAFAEFLVSEEAQAFIETFGVDEFGEPLFVPDAGKTEDEVREGG
ncbi:MAG: substrate-binding domain-containing protein [Dehalococcoidia bacterium]